MPPEAILFAFLLFCLRVLNYAVSTVRLVAIARGRRFIAAITAFMEALIFAVVISSIVTDLSNMVNLFAFCFGAAIGSYVGMWLEARFIRTYSTVQAVTRDDGSALAERLRTNGYGVTHTQGMGREGIVGIVRSTVNSKDVPQLLTEIRSVNPAAFIEVETARTIQRGYMPGMPRGAMD